MNNHEKLHGERKKTSSVKTPKESEKQASKTNGKQETDSRQVN